MFGAGAMGCYKKVIKSESPGMDSVWLLEESDFHFHLQFTFCLE